MMLLFQSGDEERERGGGDWRRRQCLAAAMFVRIPADEMVRNLPLVCKPWKEAVADPYCWRDIDVAEWCHRLNDSRAVDLAVGKLVRWSRCMFERFSACLLGNSGFEFIANQCLSVLQIPMSGITDDVVLKHVKSMPNIRVLDISECSNVSVKGVEAFGNQCKRLVSLKRNMIPQWFWSDLGEIPSSVDDSKANAIANSMSNLQHLVYCRLVSLELESLGYSTQLIPLHVKDCLGEEVWESVKHKYWQ